jgi:hypothetical protein
LYETADLITANQPPYRDVPCGQGEGEGEPTQYRAADQPCLFEKARELQASQRCRDQSGDDLRAEKSSAAAEPVGHYARPRAEHERTRELSAGDQSHREHRVGQAVSEQHLGRVLEPRP